MNDTPIYSELQMQELLDNICPECQINARKMLEVWKVRISERDRIERESGTEPKGSLNETAERQFEVEQRRIGSDD
jgi:hypothetical protein